MNIIFWSLEVFLFLMCLVCVKAILDPKAHAEWTLARTKDQMKFYGFEGNIKTTEKSAAVIRNGHALVLIGIVLLMILNVLLI